MSERLTLLKQDLKRNNFELELIYNSDLLIVYHIIDKINGTYIGELVYQCNAMQPLSYKLYENSLDYCYDKPFECIKRLLNVIHDYM